MPGPTLSPEEIAQMTAEKTKAESASAAFTSQVAAQQARAAELAVVDTGYKKFYDWYDLDIIGKYDAERKLINGQYIAAPVLESELVSCGSLLGGRLQPALPVTDIIRIPEFDGTPLVTDALNELQMITDQVPLETHLTSGWPGTAPALTVLTDTTITSSSTTLQLKDLSLTFTIVPNQVYVIENATEVCVFQVNTAVMQVAPAPPPYIMDLTITILVPPAGTIAIGKNLKIFTGFTNAERTTKTPVSSMYQGLMNYLVLQLQNKINQRIANLTSQLASISTNQDPDGVTELNTATTNVNGSKSFLTTYLVSTDVSNTGLTSLSTERGSRTTQANTRVSQINSAYTGRTKNYYNERYNFANNRANTSRGSLRQQLAAQQAASSTQGMASSLTAMAGALGSVLP